MKNKEKKEERAELVMEALKLVWDSLDSHLSHAAWGVDKKFHKKTIREYSRLIVILTKLY